jgi:NAD(P)-dependent dehydrogenase (short-subunit alcohol dehydrogenase family)
MAGEDPIVPGMSLPDISLQSSSSSSSSSSAETAAESAAPSSSSSSSSSSNTSSYSVALLSQIPIIPSDHVREASSLDDVASSSQGQGAAGSTLSMPRTPQDLRQAAAFPAGALDVNEQQVDTRKVNSWMLKLDEVSTGEAAEVMAINYLAPFIINGRLRGLMERSKPLRANAEGAGADAGEDGVEGKRRKKPDELKFIVNVSAMEGKFYRFKTSHHPHTNCAKASLNMMTRTCADEYRKTSGIYMTAVDTVGE